MNSSHASHLSPTKTEWAVWALAWVMVFYAMVEAWVAPQAPITLGWLTLGFGFLALVIWLERNSTRWGWASRVTLLRALITLSLAAFLWWPASFQQHGLALGLLGLVALLADGLDGYLARRFGEASPTGARFDMETDAALMLVLCVMVWWGDRAGAWVLIIGALRYLFILAGQIWPWLSASLPDSMRRKVICVVQVSVLLAVMPPWFSDLQAQLLLAIALALLLYSFSVDTLYLYRNQAIKP